MSQFNSPPSKGFSVVAGPNPYPRKRAGDTDGLYWVRSSEWNTHTWFGPFVTGPLADAYAQAELRRLYIRETPFEATLIVEWGKRYWIPNDGGIGGRWLLLPEAAYVSAHDLPDMGDDDAPPTVPPILSAQYAAVNLLLQNPRVSAGPTELYGPLAGYACAIVTENYVQRDDVQYGPLFFNSYNGEIGQPPENKIWANFTVDESLIPTGYTLSGCQVKYVQQQRTSRIVWRPDEYTEVSHSDHSDTLIWQPADPANAVQGYDPLTGNVLSLIPANEWIQIDAPDYLVIDPTDIDNMPAGNLLVDNTFAYVRVIYMYRPSYSDGQGNTIEGDWVTDAAPFQFANQVSGPYAIRVASMDWVYGDEILAKDASYNNVEETVPCYFDVPQGVDIYAGPPNASLPLTGDMAAWAYLTTEEDFGPPGGEPGYVPFSGTTLLNNKTCYTITIATLAETPLPQQGKAARTVDGNGNPAQPPIYSWGEFYAWHVAAIPVWQVAPAGETPIYPNGATWLQFDNTPSWGYSPGSPPAKPESLTLSPAPAIQGVGSRTVTPAQNAQGYIAQDYCIPITASPFQACPPDDITVYSGTYITYFLGTITLWIVQDGKPEALYDNGSADYRFVLANGRAAYYNVGFQPPITPTDQVLYTTPAGDVVVGFDVDTIDQIDPTGPPYTIYNGPHFAQGPFTFYVNADQNIVPSPGPDNVGQVIVTPGSVYEPDMPFGSVTVDTPTGPQTINIYRRPQRRIATR